MGQNGTGNKSPRPGIFLYEMSSREPGTPDRIRRFEADVLVHLDDLYRAALRLTGNAAEAQDLTQDTCLRAFERLDQLRSPAAARVWVFTILRSIFLRRIERQSRTVDVQIIDSPLLEAGEGLQDTYEALRPIQETPLGEVREAMGRLPLAFCEASFASRRAAHGAPDDLQRSPASDRRVPRRRAVGRRHPAGARAFRDL